MDRRSFLIRGGKAVLGTAFIDIGMNMFGPDSSAGTGTDTGSTAEDNLTLFLSGDVMTGRGIDQVLPASVDPSIYERYTKNAGRYVRLARRASGDIPGEITWSYLWGDALAVLEEVAPDIRIINLETAVTTSNDYWKDKGIHYRMHPDNVSLFTEAGIDICVLGNNHILDWGYDGLRETIRSLREAGLQTAGAGEDRTSAAAPAVRETGSGRLLVFSFATPSAGIPVTWRAREGRPGVNFLPEISRQTAETVAGEIRRHRRTGDRVVVSIHWGNNWGYEIPGQQRTFARALIDSGTTDIIHGHSSHHPKGIEIYKNRAVFYGCGDLINDYEGIGGREEFRGDLSLMYFPELNVSGELTSLRMAPMQIHRFSLRRPSDNDTDWLRDTLNRECGRFGHIVTRTGDGYLEIPLRH